MVGCHLSTRPAAVTSVREQSTCEVAAKLNIYGGSADMYVRNDEHLSTRAYLYICICSFIFTLSAR